MGRARLAFFGLLLLVATGGCGTVLNLQQQEDD
jgi:hypothetical protein